eukprot:TRINITY_DN1717_c0_g1_i1.p1 TRINITY_DN1717_c0_g1~~TRINITY_DN1717_c0_g1_i1.p1  ORF type:complete len:908 (+),score=142.50 TRINITY_DN1717_c0_g1_i1:86-2809(+)
MLRVALIICFGVVVLANLYEVTAHCVWRYDAESSWVPVDDVLPNVVCEGNIQQLVWNGSRVIVAGDFHVYSATEVTADIVAVNMSTGGWNSFPSFPVVSSHSNLVNRVQVVGSEIVVGGSFSFINPAGVVFENILIVNGSSILDWNNCATGVSGYISTLTSARGLVLIGGAFTRIGTQWNTPRQYAVYNVSAGLWWQQRTYDPVNPSVLVHNDTTFWAADVIGPGITSLRSWPAGESQFIPPNSMIVGAVYAIAFFQSFVVVGGDFTAINGLPFNQIAMMDSNLVWHAIGGGPMLQRTFGVPRVSSIAVLNNQPQLSMCVSGWFDQLAGIGGTASLACYNAESGWYGLAQGFSGMVSSVVSNGTVIFVGTWLYCTPIEAKSAGFLIYVFGSIIMGILLVFGGFFTVQRLRNIKRGPRAELIAQRLSTLTVLLALMVTVSVSTRIGVVGAIAFLPGSTLQLGHRIYSSTRVVMFLVAGGVAPIAGFVSNVVSARLLLTLALASVAVASVVLGFMVTAWMAYISAVLSAIGLGIAFTTSLAYFARASPVSLVGPMLVLFFTSNTCVDLFNNIFTLAFKTGALQEDFAGHSFIQGGVAFLTLVLLWVGFREIPLHSDKRLSIRSQFSFSRTAGIVLTLMYGLMQLAQGAFERTPTTFLRLPTTELVMYMGGISLSFVLVIVFYALYRWTSKGPRFMLILSLVLSSLGYGCIMIALFPLPNNIALITQSAQLVPFFIGAVLVDSMFEILFAVVATLFASIITQASKGTALGLFAMIGLVANGAGNEIVVLVLDENISPFSHGILMVVLMGVALCMLALIARIYHRLLPMMRLPMVPTSLFMTSPAPEIDADKTQPLNAVPSAPRPLALLLDSRDREHLEIVSPPLRQQQRMYATFAAGLHADESLHYSNLD